MTADQTVERAANKLQQLANQLAGEGGLRSKLAQPLAEDADLIRKMKPSLIKARAKGEAPAAKPPVRDSGRGEGVWGNREVPPASRRNAGDPAATRAFGRFEVEDVSFVYPDADRPALDEVSLEIGAGEIVALVGENGSGKTTLAKLVAGLYRPERGRILRDGVDTSALDPDELRASVAVIFQDFARFLLPAHENVGLGRHERIDDRDAVVAAAQRAGAHDFLAALPEGYETMLGREFHGGWDLSIGQWQRVALARAFFRDAPFVILDEPTAALDARAESDLFERMRELLAGRAVLLISHRFSSVRSADRIYVLHEGRVVEHGRHEELMALGGLYAELFTLQARQYVDVPSSDAPPRMSFSTFDAPPFLIGADFPGSIDADGGGDATPP